MAKTALLAEAVVIWNEVCGDLLPRVLDMSDKRGRNFAVRFQDCLGSDLAGWREYCEAIIATDFLTGGSRSGWRADFDWALRPDSFVAMREGKYSSRPQISGRGPPKLAGSAGDRQADNLRANRDIMRQVTGLPPIPTDEFPGPTIDQTGAPIEQ